MKPQTISYSAVGICLFLVAFAVLLGTSSNAQSPSPLHAPNSPRQKVNKSTPVPIQTNTRMHYRITDLGTPGALSRNHKRIDLNSLLPAGSEWVLWDAHGIND